MTSADNLRQGLEPHTSLFERFHETLSRRSLPNLSADYDVAAITRIILAGCETTMRIAFLIANSLITYLDLRETQITALRAIPAYLFSDNQSWPIVEWKEQDDIMTIAVFHFDNIDEPDEGSWVMHSGRRVAGDTIPEKNRWQQSRIDWNVAEIDHLKILFRVVQHMLGLLEMSPMDALEIIRDISSNNSLILIEYFPKTPL